MLGIPNVIDRVAQSAAVLPLEPNVEKVFHNDSYGYRPGRSPVDAVRVCRKRCFQKDWVVDMDVKAFFDSVPWDLMLKAVAATRPAMGHVVCGALVESADAGPMAPWSTGPRALPRAAISPYRQHLPAFDSWLEREWPTVEFERFADDAVVHCATERQARQVWATLAERMESVGLRLHPDKTKIVYCGDSNRRREFRE